MGAYYESSLNDSVIFKTLNNNGNLTSIMANVIRTGKALDESFLEEQLLLINKTKLSPLADKVIDAYKKGDIAVIFSDTARVPQALPFTVLKVQGKLKAFVFVNNYGTLTKAKDVGDKQYLNMPAKDLYVLLEGAYIGLRYYEYPVSIIRNNGLMKTIDMIYTAMFLRLLNKEYSLSIDKELNDKVTFVVSKFFLEKVWGSSNESINTSYSLNNILTPTNATIVQANEEYNSAKPQTVEELLALISTFSPRFQSLTMRYFTQMYLNTYKAPAIFSMECLPYTIFTICGSMLGSFIINQPIIMDIIKGIRGANTLYPELMKSV